MFLLGLLIWIGVCHFCNIQPSYISLIMELLRGFLSFKPFHRIGLSDNIVREELFYQLGLRQFGDYNRLKLEPPPPLRTMVKLAVDAEDGTSQSRLSKEQIVDVCRNIGY